MTEAAVQEWDKDEELAHLRQEVRHLTSELAACKARLPVSEHLRGLVIFGYGSLCWNVRISCLFPRVSSSLSP